MSESAGTPTITFSSAQDLLSWEPNVKREGIVLTFLTNGDAKLGEKIFNELLQRAELAESPLASHAEREDETAWLIERGQAFNQSPPLWWKFDEAKSTRPNAVYASYEELWTTNANEARRFKTKEVAEEYARREVYHFYQVTEHSWIAPFPAGPDALADTSDEERVRDLAQRMIGRWNGPSEMLLGFLRLLLRSRPAQEDSRDAELASAARRYVGIYKGWIKCEDEGAALNAAFNELCDAAMSQQEEK